MGVLNKMADIFQLDDVTWMKHSNPMSVYTRYTALPLIILAIWSRDWLGYYSLIFLGLAFLWTYYNPVLFSKPKTTKTWASRAVFGERAYLNHKNIPVEAHHMNMLKVINSIMTLGLPFLVYGLWTLSIWPTILWMAIVIMWKTWFLDRMVWIYLDMKDSHKEYKSWDY